MTITGINLWELNLKALITYACTDSALFDRATEQAERISATESFLYSCLSKNCAVRRSIRKSGSPTPRSWCHLGSPASTIMHMLTKWGALKSEHIKFRLRPKDASMADGALKALIDSGLVIQKSDGYYYVVRAKVA